MLIIEVEPPYFHNLNLQFGSTALTGLWNHQMNQLQIPNLVVDAEIGYRSRTKFGMTLTVSIQHDIIRDDTYCVDSAWHCCVSSE